MKIVALLLTVFALQMASCSTPGPITARPDPNSSTSGTLGSVKATDGGNPEMMAARAASDSARRRRDSTNQ